MLLFKQIDGLKARFDTYQTKLRKTGTSHIDIDNNLKETEVFQECFNLKCSLQHMWKNFKVFEDILHDLLVKQVSKAKFVATNKIYKHKKK